MPSYELVSEPSEPRAPTLVVSFEDWVDAGRAGSTAARHIAEEGEVVARFDTDHLYDYRSHRPVLDIVDGKPESFVWPEMTLTKRSLEERDLFVLTGPEPDSNWRSFARDVLELSLRIGVIEHVSLGAIPAAVPHTVPTPVMMTASNEDLMKGGAPAAGLLRVPAAAVSLVEWTLAESGVPAVGFWAQVPHYAVPFAPGSIALIRKLEDHLGITIGAGTLEEEASSQKAALEKMFSDNPEASAYLERLEGLVPEEEIPSAENIAQEVERFLRNQRGDEGAGPFGS